MINRIHLRRLAGPSAVAAAIASMSAAASAQGTAVDGLGIPNSFAWSTVVNISNDVPGTTRKFNSFNQPSVNSGGLVAFRARSKGETEPVRGIYARQMGRETGPIDVVFDTMTTVPDPNNTLYNGKPVTFTEFPAFPRIGLISSTIVSRAQSQPVWTYTLPDGTESRLGSSGVYMKRFGVRRTAMSQLGALPDFTRFSVPGATPGTKFDQFPGSPAVAGNNTLVFKGNFTDGTPKTGVYARRISSDNLQDTWLIADSNTQIPGQADGGAITFGSTAPPSATGSGVVFLGVDNEESPTLGGLYHAPLSHKPQLKSLVRIGGSVPGEAEGVTFSRLGEALSYDGRFVAFWGSWGTETRQLTLQCPADGNKDVVAYCNQTYPDGYNVGIPVKQGFFLHDVRTGATHAVAKTGSGFDDFLYWTFSGRPPGGTESDSEDFEYPRWRSAAFAATFGQGGKAQVAFKARKLTTPAIDGIYLTVAPASALTYRTVIDTTMAATVLDPMAPATAKVLTVGLERDGLRNGWLALSSSMLDEGTSASWAGIYVTRTRPSN